MKSNLLQGLRLLRRRWIRLRSSASGCLCLLPAAFVFSAATLEAQCIVNRTAGSSLNINRPSDAEVPAAEFSPLEHVNDALPAWLCFSAGYRARVEGNSAVSFRDLVHGSYLLTRFRLGVAIKPLEWATVYAELQDATAFWRQSPLVPPYQSTWDLRRAYVDINDFEHSPFTLRVGRQDLNVGNGRLIGTSYWRNASGGWDAVVLALNSSRVRATAFSASPVIMRPNGLNHHQPGNDVHGVSLVVKNPVFESELEPYVFWRLSPGFKTEAGVPAKLNEKTAGVRWAGTAAGFLFDVEGATQWGHTGSDPMRAHAVTAIAGYTFRSFWLRPRIFAEYDYASGDRNSKDGHRGTFDQLYPNIHGHHGLADQIAWQNLKATRTGFRLSIWRNWTAAGTYNNWWLASASDGLYSSIGGLVARDPKGLSGTHVGEEYDAESSLRVNRNVEFGAGVARVLPGTFLLHTSRNKAFTYSYVMVNYNVF